MKKLTVADVEGQWQDANWESGLIERCKNAWYKNIESLTNEEMAAFLRQKIAVEHILPLAIQRINNKYDDDTEIYEGELRDIVEKMK